MITKFAFVCRKAHGDALHKLIPRSHWVSGDDDLKTREYVFSKLRKSTEKKVVAICTNLGAQGLDVFVHHVINAAGSFTSKRFSTYEVLTHPRIGGKDANMLIQKIGRGLRKADDKSTLDFHDFIFKDSSTFRRHTYHRIRTLKSEGFEVIKHKTLPGATLANE